jgi:hypothetical protein
VGWGRAAPDEPGAGAAEAGATPAAAEDAADDADDFETPGIG